MLQNLFWAAVVALCLLLFNSIFFTVIVRKGFGEALKITVYQSLALVAMICALEIVGL